MIDFNKYGIEYDPMVDYNVVPSDLLAIGNIGRSLVETKVVTDNYDVVVVSGEYELSDVYAVAGGEIVYVSSSKKTSDKTTILQLERGQYGTTSGKWDGYNFRTVEILDSKNPDMDLVDWTFEDTVGGVGSSLFPVELGSGSITINTDLKLWSPTSMLQKYRVRNRKSVVYIFKGINGKRFLKFTTVVSKLGINTRSKSESSRVRLDVKTKLATWYDKDLSVNRQLKGTNPLEFFKLIFGLEDGEVYYANGIGEDSFLKINNLHTKEYKKVSEILKAYCSNGVRFCFDKYERVKVFSDFKIDGIESQKTIYEDLTESTLTEDEAMIYNTISTQAVQRQTMYNFADLQNKYVMYAKVLRGAISSDKLLKKAENGDLVVNGLEIVNEELHKSSQIGDIVCFKTTRAPFQEVYAKILDLDVGNMVRITPILYDKDFKLFHYGKANYLYGFLNNNICPLDLYYVRQELPMIFKYTRNKGGEEKDSSLAYPLLPRVNGETLYPTETNITFGCASNLKVGEYTGIVEEVDKIYGTWDSSKLLYNMEIDQFSNGNYPPIFALTNKANERVTTSNTFMLDYTNFDNKDFLLEIKEPKENSNDATLIMYNTATVNKDIDLHVETEISRIGNRILEVSELVSYKVGDVIIANRMDDLTPQEETEFDEVLSTIRWTITGKESQTKDGITFKHYIYLDSNFAKRQSKDKKYSFTRFPNWSIVFLQELYFRGNPVIEFKQDVVGVSKGVNYDGDRSTDIYGEKKYEFDSKQLDKENMKKMMGYILDHFQAVTLNSTKFTVPISTYNGIDIELLDVLTILDPKNTQIDERNKWVVVSTTNKAKTNVVQLKLLNLNNSNTVPFKLDVKDVLEYKPVEIPTYDHNGNEGNGGGDNDGSGGDGVDESIGTFNMSEVDPQIFRARVEKFEGNYIYFKDLAGSEWETYAGKLFPESEFGVSIDGETMLVQSDMNYRAFVRKRDVYGVGEPTMIAPESEVKFLLMTSFTDLDGQFYSRRCMIGDGDTYFKFHPITGAKFVGDFLVGEGNDHAGNDLWESLQKNKTFYQDFVPKSDNSYTLREGDIWYDLNDENHVYRYNGSVWQSCRDNSIISGQSSSFVQPEPPTASIGRPINNGDVWYDSDDGNKPYVYKDGEWICVTDGNLQDEIDKAGDRIDGIMSDLKEMSSDDKISPTEKQALKKEIDVINVEYPKNIAKANAYGVTTGGYAAAYENLISYIAPLIQDLTTTTDINGTVFRKKFADYYEYEIDLTGKIYDKVKESAVNESKDYADLIDKKVESYASDGVLTPSEKADLKSEIETIELKSETLKSRASIFGIDVTSLSATVGKLTVWKNGVLSQEGNYTDREQIAVLRTDFKNHYVEEENVYDSIEKKAKELADNAQKDADGALELLTDIASDGKLTASEKQQAKKEWEIIQAEYPQNISKANAYVVSTATYTEKYNSLKGYIEPLISNLTTTTNIDGAVFRSNFKNYYEAETVLTGKIYDKVKESAVNESKDYADLIDKKVESYASDGVLTPSEKADLKREIETIESTSVTLKLRASLFEVSTTKLEQCLVVLTNWKTILSQTGNFEDKAQINILRTAFKNYYVEEENVYDGIEKKAKELADNAQSDANGALGMLADIASDGKLTQSEKQQTKKEWEIIKGEFPKIMGEATKFGVDKSIYSAAYTGLESYLYPLLLDMKVVSDIIGESFRLTFKNYYDKRQDLLNDLNQAIKDSAVNASKDYADVVIGALGDDLENQIDGKINTYSQEADPSVGWDSSQKQEATGDLWYKPSEKMTRRWDSTKWVDLDAKDKVAQELAQSKRKVYTTQPTTPYDAGDLWITNMSSTGDMMICAVSRGSGSYVASDWKVATKYTDDGKANEAMQKALEAQNDANGVQSQVNDMSSDNKLSPIEKQQAKKEMDIILAEYPQNMAKANSYGVSTAPYVNCYNLLNSYINPLLINLGVTSDIVGDTFRGHFKNYYDSEIKLTGDIYDKVKESAVDDSKKHADLVDKKVEEYASDNVLTPSEKTSLKSEVDIIEGEINTIVGRASVFGVGIGNIWDTWSTMSWWRDNVFVVGGNYVGDTTSFRSGIKGYYAVRETIIDSIDKKAKELADKAQSDANGALGLLTDIASDDKLTASEKQSTKKEVGVIQTEYQKNIDQARVYGVNYDVYSQSYTTLISYVLPLLSDLNSTSNIYGVGFRATFEDYYSKRTDLLSSIASKSLEIGFMQNGKMLYLDPTFKNGTNNINVYGNGLVSIGRMTGASFGKAPPNDSDTVLAIIKSSGATSPNLGGFYFGVPTRAGMKLLTKIVAYIPVGYKINWYSNATGDNSNQYWVTEQLGVGEFREYVHVVECGRTGTFSSTAFFALEALDGNQSQAMAWGLSYATVFDAGANQNDYLTQALGNAKIFFSTNPPTSGMKENDMWYDTDDGNHPYIYSGGRWISARDKIFETEGGNKVYFQDSQPLTSGVGIKDGDMWFKTNENNKMFILTKGVWKLADDALDKVNTGRIVLNGNTTINGDFKVNGKNINLTGDTSVTGMLNVYGGDKGITSYNGATEANSTRKIIIKGGVIEFWEKV